MTSDKAGAALLAEICVHYGLEYIVISPGSRNAPLIIAFANHPKIKAITIVDERSAAFFALGIAQQTGKPVAITCTSGSATLNYAPAIAEAYYQKIPLLVVTADRPANLIDNGDGQTIRQKDVYANYIKANYEIQGELDRAKEVDDAKTTISEVVEQTLFPDAGPVHINMPFEEPIYNQIEQTPEVGNLNVLKEQRFELESSKIEKYAERWNSAKKILLIAGMMKPNAYLQKVLNEITKDPRVVLLSETTSNLNCACSCSCIDKVVHTITHEEIEDFKPDLLLTFGGHVVSKMIKTFLRTNKPETHWHIHPVDTKMDTYFSLTEGIAIKPEDLFIEMHARIKTGEGNFKQVWKDRSERSELRHKEFLNKCGYSDLTVFEEIISRLPAGTILQLGNSTPVRYAQLFKQKSGIDHFSNRGTSGIDGAMSTAAGAAFARNKPVVLITGDLGFFYDSNALMNAYLPPNLKIILINNGGGGIFRFIPGPDNTPQLEEYFEAKHNWSAENIAKAFDVQYFHACSMSQLEETLSHFFDQVNQKQTSLLEIKTPARKNSHILRSYFKYLRD